MRDAELAHGMRIVCGYAGDGINRGRLAIPIACFDGAVVAYIGRTPKDEQPVFTCRKDFNPFDTKANSILWRR